MNFILIKATRLLAVSSLVFGIAIQAQAYDVDTHFYATYAMARYAGMKHPAAAKLATSAQWMDESYLSDPTSMIFLPITGIKKRRLLHFPGSRISGKLNAQAQQSVVEEYRNQFSSTIEEVILTALKNYSGKDVKVDNLNFKSEVAEAHPFATELLMEGLREGNLMKAGASLHVLEDSFAHAGTPAEEGHAAFWHWPDRPYSSVDKYWRMVDSVFAALVAIRNQLPPEALDCNYKNLNGTSLLTIPNCQATAQELSQSYRNIPDFQEAVKSNILVEPEYVKTSITYLTDLAIDVGYLQMDKTQVPTLVESLNIQPGTNGFTVFSNLLETFMTEPTPKPRTQVDGRACPVNLCLESGCALKLCPMLYDMGQIKCQEKSLIDLINARLVNSSAAVSQVCVDEVALKSFTERTAHELLRWHVPIPLDDTHRVEFEDDSSPVRKKEMEIRIRNMRTAISKNFGIDVEFLPNNSPDDIGLWREFYADPIVEAVIPESLSGTVYVTFNLREKQAWDLTIFSYLFPSLSKADLEALIQVGAIFKQSLEEDKSFFEDAQGLITGKLDSDKSVGSIVAKNLWTILGKKPKYEKIISLLSPISSDFLSDLFLTRMTPNAANMYYANPYVLQKYQKDWPLFLSPQDVWQLNEFEFSSFGQN